MKATPPLDRFCVPPCLSFSDIGTHHTGTVVMQPESHTRLCSFDAQPHASRRETERQKLYKPPAITGPWLAANDRTLALNPI